MKVLKPITFNNTQLISTTATETEATWLVGTTYSLGAKVQYGIRLYESLVASNLGNTPDTNPTKWLDYSPDNRRAMFDNQVGTQTKRASSISVVVRPANNFNSLAALNMVGTSVVVSVKDNPTGSVVYTKNLSLDDTIILDWYMYFFEPYDLKSDIVLTDIPVYSTSEITFTLNGGSDCAIGSLIYGTIYDLGGTQYGATIGIKDYSIKNTDSFGNTSFVQRAFSKRMETQIYMDNTKLNYNYKLLSEIRAIPSLWIGSDDSNYNPLVIFGYYRDFNIAIQYPTYSLCSLSVEGLI